MVFSSLLFLIVFLPATSVIYFLVPRKLRNVVLLTSSLLFYWWGTRQFWALIVISICLDYCCGWGQVLTKKIPYKRVFLSISIVGNLGLLAYFKYYNFFVSAANELLRFFDLSVPMVSNIALPIGISFYTFQTISYQIDLYRGRIRHQKNIFTFSLFVALFPQLIAGPIVRYREIAEALERRRESLEMFSQGIQRFVIGLGKKVLIANQLALFSDYAFSRSSDSLPPGLAWLGALTFALQIYFDFDAYSDMAIGLGRMFGFRFPENFNYPYIARSFGELWKRWHMTLMRWFRDYVVWGLRKLPGNRAANARNIFVVFILCGLWHGASWHYVVWGGVHGALLVFERAGGLKRVQALPVLFQNLYVLSLWVFLAPLFRADSLSASAEYMKVMLFLNGPASYDASFYTFWHWNLISLLLISMLLSVPIVPYVQAKIQEAVAKARRESRTHLVSLASQATVIIGIMTLTLYCLATLVSTTKSPFIYFKF